MTIDGLFTVNNYSLKEHVKKTIVASMSLLHSLIGIQGKEWVFRGSLQYKKNIEFGTQ